MPCREPSSFAASIGDRFPFLRMSAALRALRAVHASISFGARGPSRPASEPGGSLVARPRRPPVQFVLEKEIPMLTALSGYIRDRWPFSHTVRIAGLENFVERCHAEAWHIYAIKKRIWRRHVCIACGWLADSLPRDARIFPRCGAGLRNILSGFPVKKWRISPRATASASCGIRCCARARRGPYICWKAGRRQ